MSGCHGACSCGPSVIIQPGNHQYVEVKPDGIPEIIDHHVDVNENDVVST
jgi:(2Fe-2S) ferredoxin